MVELLHQVQKRTFRAGEGCRGGGAHFLQVTIQSKLFLFKVQSLDNNTDSQEYYATIYTLVIRSSKVKTQLSFLSISRYYHTLTQLVDQSEGSIPRGLLICQLNYLHHTQSRHHDQSFVAEFMQSFVNSEFGRTSPIFWVIHFLTPIFCSFISTSPFFSQNY